MADPNRNAAGQQDDLYSHLPLNRNAKEIRILDLLVGPQSSALRCRIRIVSLEESPSYEALSYTWGSSTLQRSITVLPPHNIEHEVPITDNLYNALQGLRPRFGRSISIWVDTICINQADDVEKSWQVGMMGRIYSSVRSVNVWLGEPYHTKEAKALRKRIRRRLIRPWCQGISLIYENPREIPAWLRLLPWVLTCRSQLLLEALDTCQPRWATRAWVRQEVALPPKAYLCFGRARIRMSKDTPVHFNMIIGLLRVVNHYPDDDRVNNPLDQLASQLSRWRPPGASDLSKPLRLLTYETINEVNATDARDLVYSLLGLARSSERSGSRPIVSNYTQPLWAVWAEATTTIVEQALDEPLEVLKYANFGRSRVQGLPSWALDFYGSPFFRVSQPLAMTPDTTDLRLECQTPSGQISVLSKDAKQLTIRGFYLASIVEFCLFLPLRHDLSDGSLDSPMHPVARNLIQLAKNHDLRMSGTTTGQTSEDESRSIFQQRLRGILTAVLQESPHTSTDYLAKDGDKYQGYPLSLVASLLLKRWKSLTGWSRFRLDRRTKLSGGIERDMASDTHLLLRMEDFLRDAERSGEGSIASLQNGFLAVCAGPIAVGDKVVLAHGSDLALVVRDSPGGVALRGIAYVQGLMDGELAIICNGFDIKDEEFVVC